MTFGEKLKWISHLLPISIRELASQADVPASSLQSLIDNDRGPKASVALWVARAVSVPLEWLVDKEQGLDSLQRLNQAMKGDKGEDWESRVRREFALARQELALKKGRRAMKVQT